MREERNEENKTQGTKTKQIIGLEALDEHCFVSLSQYAVLPCPSHAPSKFIVFYPLFFYVFIHSCINFSSGEAKIGVMLAVELSLAPAKEI